MPGKKTKANVKSKPDRNYTSCSRTVVPNLLALGPTFTYDSLPGLFSPPPQDQK